ncbi:cupredoxin family copper-binding protein [Kutzneria kofuensis]|uniref:cupredoxin domain-containing protein n=1 Tax=Kutzneria kofuensis TaxID=103725 RepID=UPI0031ED5245
MTRRLLSILLTIPLLAVLAPTPAMAASQAVTMAQYAFAPASLTVHVGDTITWTNQDQAPHDVTTRRRTGRVHSPMLMTGQSWTYTFTQPGTYAYICSIHPDMKAQIPCWPRRPRRHRSSGRADHRRTSHDGRRRARRRRPSDHDDRTCRPPLLLPLRRR